MSDTNKKRQFFGLLLRFSVVRCSNSDLQIGHDLLTFFTGKFLIALVIAIDTLFLPPTSATGVRDLMLSNVLTCPNSFQSLCAC